MRPVRATAVHKTDGLAELVCSNSFRGDKLDNAVGLLKEEMRRLGSIVMRAADAARVPAGAALAVDRERFSAEVTRAVTSHPRITIVREEVAACAGRADGPVIIATGPLTSDALSADIAALVGGEPPVLLRRDQSDRARREHRHGSKVFRASRWGTKPARRTHVARSGAKPRCGVDDGEGDYLNCPFTADEYAALLPGADERREARRCTSSTRRSSSKAACRSR